VSGDGLNTKESALQGGYPHHNALCVTLLGVCSHFRFFFSLLENVADTEVSYRGNEKIPSSRSEQFEVTNEL
jgi:hypothetical protein